MAVTLRRMTLRDVLARHGITTLRDFCARTGFSRQHGWNLMNGWTGVGKRTTQILHERLEIPFEELMQIRPVPRSARHQKPPPERGAPE
jgi:hypothetical protein